MRNPRRKRNIALTLLAASVAAIVIGLSMPDAGRDFTLQSALAGGGIIVGPFAAVWAVLRTRDSYRYGRLKRGEGVIARWMVTREQWREFRALDEQVNINNELDLRIEPPPSGLEVVVSEDAVCAGEDFFALQPNVVITLHDTWIQFDQVLQNPDGFDGLEVMRIPLPAEARSAAAEILRRYRSAHAVAKERGRRWKIYLLIGLAVFLIVGFWLALAGS